MPNVFESTENVDAMLRSKRVLVVGNGPSARSVKIPEIMGYYDLVVRFNCWKKDSHTAGERCDVWVTNMSPHDTENHLPKAAAEGYKASLFLICTGLGVPSSERACHFRDIIKTGFGDVPVGKVPPSFAKTLSKRVGIKVTTGLTAIHYLLSLGCEVTICGFDILAGRQCTPRHYWGGRSNIHNSHSPAKEGSILWELISSGAIRTVGDVPALWVDTSPVRSLDYFDSMQETIPRIIHLVWLGTMIPEWVRAFMKAVIDLHPQWEVKLHTDLPSSAGSELAEAYNSAEQWCQRADIVRYVALRDSGGIYIDADCVILRALDPLLKAGPFWAARQADNRFMNGFLGCEKGCKEIELILAQVVSVFRSGSSRRARYGPDMITRMVDFEKTIAINQLPKHYFAILDKQSSAHKFLHSNAQARAGRLNNLQGRIKDGVSPFLVHLWGYDGSSKSGVTLTQKAVSAVGDAALASLERMLSKDICSRDFYRLRGLPQDEFDLVVDLGGNIGVFTRHAKTLFPSAHVITVEADDRVQCHLHTRVGTMTGIEVVCAPIGTGLISYQHNRDHVNPGATIFGLEAAGSVRQIESRTLSQILGGRSVTNALIKIDIEGSEQIIFCHPETVAILRQAKRIVAETHWGPSYVRAQAGWDSFVSCDRDIMSFFSDVFDIQHINRHPRKDPRVKDGTGVLIMTRKSIAT